MDGFLWIDACVIQLTGKSQLGANRAYIHLETPKFQEVFHKH
jgi:hypothetical protein